MKTPGHFLCLRASVYAPVYAPTQLWSHSWQLGLDVGSASVTKPVPATRLSVPDTRLATRLGSDIVLGTRLRLINLFSMSQKFF
jgi:hypothetical protein